MELTVLLISFQLLLRVGHHYLSQRLQYFQTDTHEWISQRGIPELSGGDPQYMPYSMGTQPISLHSINGCIYVGMSEGRQFDRFVKFNTDTNTWTVLPRRHEPLTLFQNFLCTLHDHYIYIASYYKRNQTRHWHYQIDRFNILADTWEELPSLYVSRSITPSIPIVVHFGGKHLVSVQTEENAREMYMHNSASNTWVPVQSARQIHPKQLLRYFEHDGKQYRILYKDHTKCVRGHAVHQLTCNLDGKKPSIRIGDKVADPTNLYYYGAFSVGGEETFVYIHGNICQVDNAFWGSCEAVQDVILKEVTNDFDCVFKNGKQFVFTQHTFQKANVKMGIPGSGSMEYESQGNTTRTELIGMSFCESDLYSDY